MGTNHDRVYPLTRGYDFKRLNETTLEKRERNDKTLKSDDYAKILIARQNVRVSPFADCEREICGMGKRS